MKTFQLVVDVLRRHAVEIECELNNKSLRDEAEYRSYLQDKLSLFWKAISHLETSIPTDSK